MRSPGAYIFRDATGTPFYVGASGRDVAKRSQSHVEFVKKKAGVRTAGAMFYNKLAKIIEAGHDFSIELRATETQELAYELEIELIREFGRRDQGKGPLCNRTNGGEGTKGWWPSEATRKLWSEQRKGVVLPSMFKKRRFSKPRNGPKAWTVAQREAFRDLYADAEWREQKATRLRASLLSFYEKGGRGATFGLKRDPETGKYLSDREFETRYPEQLVSSEVDGVEVLTDTGFQTFDASVMKRHKRVYRFTLDDGSTLECTPDHRVYFSPDRQVKACKLKLGKAIIGADGGERTVIAVERGGFVPVYDLLNVAGGNKFNVGSFSVSNCKFVSGDATLVEPVRLLALNQFVRKPRLIDKHGCKWYRDIEPNTAYAVVMDPSEGVDGDNSVIQVWSVPELRQVAEWAANDADQVEQTRMLIRVLKKIHDCLDGDPEQHDVPEIYYSVECNGVGKGIVTAIEIEGEEKFPGDLIDSEKNSSRGLRTTETSKREYSLQLKTLLERGIFKPASKELLTELKNYVKRGRGYDSKPGTKKDRVMSCVLMLQLIDELKHQLDGIEEAMHVPLTDEDDTEADEPMGVIF